ncbi:Quinate permease [Colletotrichum sp. SAR 10_96]|nr:Quinate permease [Colletotrichum sp. SAR 10_96]
MLGFWINYATDQIVANDAKTQWIVPLAFQLVPGVLLFVGMMFCPESPRWLAKGDNYESAERVLAMIQGLSSDQSYIRHEMGEIRTQIEQRSTTKMSKAAKAKKLFQKGVRNRLGIGLALMFLQSFTGVNILMYSTWQGITWTVCSEIFPLDIRMLCVALTTADTWVGSFIIARTTPYMISDLGYGAYFFFSAILVGMGIWAFAFVPETKGISLEDMDALFMRPTHKIV